MGIKADKVYQGRIRGGSRLMESAARKTPGFQVMLSCEDGDSDFIIWLTPKNKEKALRDFETLGVDPARLGSQSYFLYELPLEIDGNEITFGTKAEEYNGNFTTKVAWIGKVGAGDEKALAASAAALFGNGRSSVSAPASSRPTPPPQPAPDFAQEEVDDDIHF